jgi:hypothetical protein
MTGMGILPIDCARTTMRPMVLADAIGMVRQDSQRVQLGIERPAKITEDEAAAMLASGEAWACVRDGQVVGLCGINEEFPGVQGTAWAILSPQIGSSHLTLTRHARRRIAASPLVRVQALARDSEAAEKLWARLCGMTAEAVLHKFGARSETHILYSRLKGAPHG